MRMHVVSYLLLIMMPPSVCMETSGNSSPYSQTTNGPSGPPRAGQTLSRFLTSSYIAIMTSISNNRIPIRSARSDITDSRDQTANGTMGPMVTSHIGRSEDVRPDALQDAPTLDDDVTLLPNTSVMQTLQNGSDVTTERMTVSNDSSVEGTEGDTPNSAGT